MSQDSSPFQSHAYFQRRWAQTGRELAYTSNSRTEHETWQRELIHTLKKLSGYDTMQPAPLQPCITEEVECDGYRRQRIEIQTEPGVVMPMYALIPTSGTAPYPVIIAPHGHGSGGKDAPAGIHDDPKVSEAIEIYNYEYGVRFTQAGFITFCPDARGFGERRENAQKDDILSSSCRELNNMAYPLGQTVTGMWTWDLHRLVDYIETRADCDAKRIGCAGLSGGGLQTLWATALDTRIRCAIVSGYLYGYKESLLDLHQNCSCNYVPHLYEYVDMGDIGSLISPRPLLIESGNNDPLNGAAGLGNVESQLAIIRRAYAVLAAEDKVKHVVFKGVHRWGGAEAVPWMREWL